MSARFFSRRFAALLLAVLLTVSLAACGEEPSPAAPEVTEAPQPPEVIPPEAPQAPQAPQEEIPEPIRFGRLPVDALSVVYPADKSCREDIFAQTVADALAEAYGVTVPVLADDASPLPPTAVFVGDSEKAAAKKPEGLTAADSFLAADDSCVVITGGGSLGLYGAVETMLQRIGGSGGQTLELADTETFCAESETLRCMTFNLWISQKTTERVSRVKKIITDYMPDSFGVQEANIDWLLTLMGYFTENEIPYTFVGQTNESGNGGDDATVIFYRTDKFRVLDSATKWLSETPDIPSRFEGAQGTRTVTYAVLQEIATGKTYVHANTHLDTNTHLDGKTRDQQITVMLELLEQFRDYPLVVTGDFNSRPDTAPHKAMHEAGFVSTGDVAPNAHGFETFHKYGAASPGAVIDYLFILPTRMAALNYRVCNEKIDGDYPSDHYPVIADVVFW